MNIIWNQNNAFNYPDHIPTTQFSLIDRNSYYFTREIIQLNHVKLLFV